MGGSVRHCVALATAAVATSAIVVAPPAPDRSTPAPMPVSVAKVDLAAAVTPLAPADREEFTSARAALTRLDPVSPLAAVPAPLNAASNSINSVYQWIQGWVDYGVELTQYVLQFIPYGYLIGDQIGIVYYNLVRPISDSVVYDFIDPVVNNPLNLATWVNGAIAVGSTTVTALINTGIAEFNYFFGWLIPPIPPLPLAAKVAPEETSELVTTAVTETAVTETEPAVAEVAKTTPETPVVAETTAAETKAAEAKPVVAEMTKAETAATETAPTTETVEPTETSTATVDTKDGISAQGEVRTGGQTATPESTKDASPAKEDKPTETATPSATPTKPDTAAPETPKDDPSAKPADNSDAKAS